MHIAGKIFLGLGVLLLIGGGIMTIGGGSALEGAAEWDPEEKSEFSGAVGDSSYSYPGDWEDKLVMVRDDVRCDEFSFSMTNDTGENYAIVSCEEDGEKPWGWEDDPSGWYHMATISSWDYSKGDYTINANADYEIVDSWEVLGEVIGDAAGGLMGLLGGIGIFGCGICSLILGGVLALALKEPQPPTQMA